jgi:hypothetical protein
MLKTTYFLLSICVVGKISASTLAIHPAYDFSNAPQEKLARTAPLQTQNGDDLGSAKPTAKDTKEHPQRIIYQKDKTIDSGNPGAVLPLIATDPELKIAKAGELEKPSNFKIVPYGSTLPELMYHKPGNAQPSSAFFYAPAYYEPPHFYTPQSRQVIHYYREVVVTTLFIQWYVLPIVHYIAQSPYPPAFFCHETVLHTTFRWPVCHRSFLCTNM